MSLEPCPSSPNCICSQGDASDAQHYMDPVSYTGEAAQAISAIDHVLTAAGAEVTTRTDTSIEAVFTSRFFRFKDDVVFLVDTTSQLLHFRSASRTGHSDLGANRKRLAALLPQIQAKL